MAFSLLGSLGASSDKTANQTSISVSLGGSASAAAGSLVVVAVAVDNNSATDGDEGAITSVTDSVGNTYSKAREYTNAQGGLQFGATISVWYSVLTTTLPNNAQITANFSNAASRDAAAMAAYNYGLGAGNTVLVDPGSVLVSDAFSDSTTPFTFPSHSYTISFSAEWLRFRAFAREFPNNQISTATTGWTVAGDIGTVGGPSASNITLFAEAKISANVVETSVPTATTSIQGSDFVSVHVAFYETIAGSVVEAGAATETVDAIGTFGRTQTDAGSAVETADTTGDYNVAVSETGSATDFQTPNPLNERGGLLAFGPVAGGALAAVNPKGSYSVSVAETGAATDSQFLGFSELVEDGENVDDTSDGELDGVIVNPPLAPVTITLVGTQKNAGTPGTAGITSAGTAITLQVGDLVFIHYAVTGTSFPPVTFTTTLGVGTGLSAISTNAFRTTAAGYTVGYAVVTTAGTLTSVKANHANSGTAQAALTVSVFRATYPFANPPLDVYQTPVNDITPSFLTPFTGPLAQADELVVGIYSATPGLSATGGTTTAAFAGTGTKSGTVSAHVNYQLVSSTATVQNSFTYSKPMVISAVGTVNVLTFKVQVPTVSTNRGRFFAFF